MDTMKKYLTKEIRVILYAIDILQEKGFPVDKKIFDAWCSTCITVPIELSVLRVTNKKKLEVLMIHREDKFFHGWHIPGTVMLPGDTEACALARLRDKHVLADTSEPVFVDRLHVPVNQENKRGQMAELLFVSFIQGKHSGVGKFFPLHTPPNDTLAHHKKLLQRTALWWNENQP